MNRWTTVFAKLWRIGYGALGSLYYQDADGFEVEIPLGAEGQALTVVDGVPTWSGAVTGGHWEPVTNGDPDNPELVFADGDVVMSWVVE